MLPESCFQSLGGLSHIPAAAPAHEMLNNISSLVGGNAIFKTGLEGRFCCKAYLYLTHGVGWSYLSVDLLLERFRSPNAYPRQLQVNWTQLRTNCTQVRVQCVANGSDDLFLLGNRCSRRCYRFHPVRRPVCVENTFFLLRWLGIVPN